MKKAITKSNFLAALQCKKKLYYRENIAQLGISPDPMTTIQQEILIAGNAVGHYCRGYFPNGIDCQGSEEITKHYLSLSPTPHTLYEAAFHCNGFKVSCDILTKFSSRTQRVGSVVSDTDQYLMADAANLDENWHLFEVKSSTTVKDYHILDGSLQYWVLKWSGLPLGTVHIMHVNGKYERTPPPHNPSSALSSSTSSVSTIDLNGLFTVENITNKANHYEQELLSKLKEYQQCLSPTSEFIPSSISIGPHCKKPYPCEFIGTCFPQANLPSYSILDLTNARTIQWKLFDQGVRSLHEIPTSAYKSLSARQLLQVLVEKHQKPFMNLKEIQKFLKNIQYPIYFLDFESFSSAIPFYDHTKPYQAICFQYSLHCQSLSSLSHDQFQTTQTALDVNPFDNPSLTLHHHSFLADGTSADPRYPFLLSLLSHLSHTTGTILVFNIASEGSRLKELMQQFPQHQHEIQQILSRMVDLAKPFNSLHLVTPEMRGKYSIKSILPALVPAMAEKYKESAISNGYQANLSYLQLMSEEHVLTDDMRRTIRENLLSYCELDTLAMVKILEKIQQMCHTTQTKEEFLRLDELESAGSKALEKEIWKQRDEEEQEEEG